MKKIVYIIFLLSTLGLAAQSDQYASLQDFYTKWRAFENPPLYNGAPDYRQATFDQRMTEYKELKAELLSIDASRWPVKQKVDWMIIWAEMNGFDFNYRVLKPWQRDPAFYKSLWTYRSDVPGHEGPTHHATTEIWQYEFPLTKESREKLISDLQVIPSLNTQAKTNLTGNAKELWIAGIKHIKDQSKNLALILNREGVAKNRALIGSLH